MTDDSNPTFHCASCEDDFPTEALAGHISMHGRQVVAGKDPDPFPAVRASLTFWAICVMAGGTAGFMFAVATGLTT